MPLRHLYHVRSNVATAQGLAKLPDVQDIGYGEIAINYAQGLETISLKNSSNEIVPFTPNTNSYVANVNAAISENSLESILTPVNVARYQDFHITYLLPDSSVFDLTDIIEYICTTYYSTTSLHIVLHVNKGDDANGMNTNFFINTDSMALLMDDANTPLNGDSSAIGFTLYSMYLVAGDSPAMNGIELNWDATTNAITVRFLYVHSVIRLDTIAHQGEFAYTIQKMTIPNVTEMDLDISVTQVGKSDILEASIPTKGDDGPSLAYYLYDNNNQCINKGYIKKWPGTIDMSQYQPSKYRLQFVDSKGAEKNFQIVKSEKK